MRIIYLYCALTFLISCESPQNEGIEKTTESTTPKKELPDAPERNLSPEFKDYWYAGVAEISNYDLKQNRYGEVREGNAVLIFVTEPFDAIDQVKADGQSDNNTSVLKLNATRDFYTGIYPYKIMSSTFLPLDKEQNALKVATSIQEWCGHTYMQLNQNGDQYDGVLHSYFQSEGNTTFEIDNVILENQIPAQLRIDPQLMAVGSIKIIPSTEYLRLTHATTKVHNATASLEKSALDGQLVYTVDYDDGRRVSYTVNAVAPYEIVSWEEEYKHRGQLSSSIATIKKSLRTPYWNQNSNRYSVLRDSLDL